MPMLTADTRPTKGAMRIDGTAPVNRSDSEPMPFCTSASEPSATIEIGVSCRFSSRFCAVTTMSATPTLSSLAPSCAAAGAAARQVAADAASAARISCIPPIDINSPSRFRAGFCPCVDSPTDE